MDTKTCKKCQKEKPIECFSGYHKKCRQCTNEEFVDKSHQIGKHKTYRGEPRHNLLGHPPFGLLAVVKDLGIRKRIRWWLCQCKCGNEKEVRQMHLLRGQVKSCGCQAVAVGSNHPQ